MNNLELIDFRSDTLSVQRFSEIPLEQVKTEVYETHNSDDPTPLEWAIEFLQYERRDFLGLIRSGYPFINVWTLYYKDLKQ